MKCGKVGKRPQATLYQLAQRKRHQEAKHDLYHPAPRSA
jgi:hypothetical protein